MNIDFLSNSVKKIKPSATISITNKANELKQSGNDVIGLGAGEPDFDTPQNIKQAAIDAIKNGKTKYTIVDGITELKKAIINKFQKENNLIYDINQITVSSGAKQVIYNALLSTINKGDEVIITAPYWVSYPDMVLLAGGKPVIINTKKNFKLSPSELEKYITPKSKWIIINSPSNPSGAIYSYQELKDICNIIKKYPNL